MNTFRIAATEICLQNHSDSTHENEHPTGG
jgi:hypothetical protein